MRVATLRILRVRDFAVPGADAGGEDLEVVAVEVHGVGGREADTVQADAHAAVVAPIVHCAHGCVRGGAELGLEEERVVVVAVVGDVVHPPDEEARRIVAARDFDADFEGGLFDCDGVHGDGFG